MNKFGRNYKLSIDATPGHEVGQGFGLGNEIVEIYPIVDPETGQRQSLTMEFDINRNILSSANTGNIRVYNLNKDTRGKIYKDRYKVTTYKGIELKAGYGDDLSLLFKGNIRQAWSSREGNNMITNIDCYDGGFEFVTAQVNENYVAGTPIKSVLEKILSTMRGSLVTGKISDYLGPDGQPLKIRRGNSVGGNSAFMAEQYSSGGFFVDLETMHCLQDNDCLPGAIKIISAESGLLNTPQREETILTLDMVFEPRLIIGQLIFLNSVTEDRFNGFYKVVSLHHRGVISDAIAGSATTTVGLWYGGNILREIQ